MKMFVLLAVLSSAVIPTARSQAVLQHHSTTSVFAPENNSAAHVRTMRELERRYAKPEPAVISSSSLEERVPGIGKLLDGADDVSAKIAKLKHGQSVSVFGIKGMAVAHRDFVITPPQPKHATFVRQYGIFSVKSENLGSKTGIGERLKF